MVVMAPPPKLKQSSIASFLKQTEPVLPESEPETKSKPSSSDYENLRQQTIRRNQSFLQTLGIHPLPFKSRPKPKPKPTATPPPSAPLRRSSRHRAPPPSPPPPQDVVIAEAPVLDFADSPVFRYACDPSITLPPTPTLPPPPSLPLFGFEITGMPLRDPSLTKIYTLDVSLLHKDRFLVAAGGHGGFISLFGVGGEEMRMPLMSWKGSRSWISGVGFLEKNPMVLVSSSNDGKVVLWDIKKQSSSVAASASASASASPAVVAEVGDLHSGGVFSMSLRGEMIATASKDSSVGVSRIRDEGEVVNERNVSGHHEGAVRGICFGDEKDRLADCGADGRICVLDLRLPQPCILTIESQHSTGINTIEWSTTNKFLLLSASKDPTLLLYDIRKSSEPIHAFQSHVESNASTCYRIYRPSFVDGGNAVATPGQGSKKISLYSIEKGTLISQGMIGYDANLVKSKGFGEHETLWAAGKQINQLRSLTNSPTKSDIFS